MQHPTPRQYLTERKAAEFVGVTSKTMQRWRAQGTAPPHYLFDSRTVRYPFNELCDWLESRKAEAA